MTDVDLDYKTMLKVVRNTARAVSSNFPTFITAEDTTGALWVWTYENKATVQKIAADGPGFESKIAPLLRKVAFDYCTRERAQVEGYAPEDMYRYTAAKITTLLADIFNYEDWQSFGTPGTGMPSARPQANQTGDRIAELIDVKIALESLPEDVYNLLVWRFQRGYTSENVADELEILPEAARKRGQRALKALQRKLGYLDRTELVGSSRRRVGTNASARANLSNNYEG
jgi:DNA-directed RNA polymerase specialized sigma24 family protein